jgi:hypothetical protein
LSIPHKNRIRSGIEAQIVSVQKASQLDPKTGWPRRSSTDSMPRRAWHRPESRKYSFGDLTMRFFKVPFQGGRSRTNRASCRNSRRALTAGPLKSSDAPSLAELRTCP